MRSPSPSYGFTSCSTHDGNSTSWPGSRSICRTPERKRAAQAGVGRVQVHARSEQRIEKREQPAAALTRVDAINAGPRGVRMIVQTEEPAAPRDVKPGVRVDEQAAAHRVVVTVQVAHELDQVPPAEFLELLQTALVRAEQPEVAFEDLRIALRERPRVHVLAALRAARQEQGAQLLVQRRAVLQLRETEGDGEERQDLGHVTGPASLQ